MGHQQATRKVDSPAVSALAAGNPRRAHNAPTPPSRNNGHWPGMDRGSLPAYICNDNHPLRVRGIQSNHNGRRTLLDHIYNSRRSLCRRRSSHTGYLVFHNSPMRHSHHVQCKGCIRTVGLQDMTTGSRLHCHSHKFPTA